MNKVVYIPAHFCVEGRYEKASVPTGKKEPGMFGFERDITREVEQFVQTGVSDCEIDAQRLAQDVTEAVEALNTQGYEVVAITPVASGRYHAEIVTSLIGEARGGLGYGFSYTKGVLITARRV